MLLKCKQKLQWKLLCQYTASREFMTAMLACFSVEMEAYDNFFFFLIFQPVSKHRIQSRWRHLSRQDVTFRFRRALMPFYLEIPSEKAALQLFAQKLPWAIVSVKLKGEDHFMFSSGYVPEILPKYKKSFKIQKYVSSPIGANILTEISI